MHRLVGWVLFGQSAAWVLPWLAHSAGGPIATDWTFPPDPVLEPVTEVVSVHGSELGYSLGSLIASAEGWPVSTTQLCVGAVVGVGLASGEDPKKAVNVKLLRRIFLSWVATPLAAGIFILFCFKVSQLTHHLFEGIFKWRIS